MTFIFSFTKHNLTSADTNFLLFSSLNITCCKQREAFFNSIKFVLTKIQSPNEQGEYQLILIFLTTIL